MHTVSDENHLSFPVCSVMLQTHTNGHSLAGWLTSYWSVYSVFFSPLCTFHKTQQLLQQRSWSKIQFCELVPSWNP